MRENIMSKKLINTPEPGITQDKSQIYKANIIKSSSRQLHSLVIF